MKLLKNTSFDFIGKRKIAFILSGVISLTGLIGMIGVVTNTANVGTYVNSSLFIGSSNAIVTSLTTFPASLSLCHFGGEVIHDFPFALVAGIIVATYSSIFIASPIVLELEVRGARGMTISE
jgi:preprotein translocase subunit SecF